MNNDKTNELHQVQRYLEEMLQVSVCLRSNLN